MCHYSDPWWSRRARAAFEAETSAAPSHGGSWSCSCWLEARASARTPWPTRCGASNPPNNVAGTIEQYVSLLRRRLFDEAALSKRAIVTEPQAYRIDTGEVRVDLDRFDSMILRAEHADVVTRRALLNDAVALAHGDLLEDAPYAPWAQWDRHVYRGRISRAHLALAHDSMMVGHYAAAVRHSEAALRFAPYSEQAFQAIMVSNYALGHTDQARHDVRPLPRGGGIARGRPDHRDRRHRRRHLRRYATERVDRQVHRPVVVVFRPDRTPRHGRRTGVNRPRRAGCGSSWPGTDRPPRRSPDPTGASPSTCGS